MALPTAPSMVAYPQYVAQETAPTIGGVKPAAKPAKTRAADPLNVKKKKKKGCC